MKLFVAGLLLLLFSLQCFADVYMHNPRGSNDRNCERDEERDNDKRLFDSENNAKGGYACPRAVGGPDVKTGRMYYYVGSHLSIEWTNQHACGGNDQASCDIVLQYMCEDTAPGIRDGTPKDTTDSATTTITAATANDPNVGQHENVSYYEDCNSRERNKGLYTADQNLNGNDATHTRQNPNGDKHGFECPEERDYYPYWHPTPWKDIAILTDDPSRCNYYKKNSQNVQNKGHCVYVSGDKPGEGTRANSWYNSKDLCEGNGQKWVEDSSYNIKAPECFAAPWSRVNHLGNTRNGYAASYNWTIPEDVHTACVVRIRYNISTSDFPQQDGVPVDHSINDDDDPSDFINFVNASYNGKNAPIKQNPYYPLDETTGKYLALAVNTDQFGRTFQDRSYVFSIRERPDNVSDRAHIYNLNVRGKRGNIVQVYPAVEYDFVPNRLTLQKGDYVHIQWTGSDYNPERGPNDAEGGPPDPNEANANDARADRSNLIQIHDMAKARPMNRSDLMGNRTGNLFRDSNAKSMFVVDDDENPDWDTIIKLAYLNQTNCLTKEEVDNANDRETNPRNCFKLNAAKTPYFDGGLVQMNRKGEFHYMSSRNNHFSNRDQKGTFIVVSSYKRQKNPDVDDDVSAGEIVGWTIFSVALLIAFILMIGTIGYIIVKGRSSNKPKKAATGDGLGSGLLQ